jgi:cytochrome P450
MLRFLSSDDARRNPFPWYAELRSVAPVYRESQSGIWMLLGHEDVSRALTDYDAFGSAVTPPTSAPGQWLIFSDPPRHATLRALMNRAFTSRAVEGMEPRIRDLARTLLGRHAAAERMDLVGDFAAPLPLMVIAQLLGAPSDDWPRFRAWSEAMLGLADTIGGGSNGGAAASAFGEAHEALRGYLADLLVARRAAPRDDLLTRLVAAEVDGSRLTDDEILGFFELLLLAGHETTTNLIANAMLCFAEYPEQLARLRHAPELLPGAIEEVLRYRSPVQAVFRTTRREVTLHDVTIPASQLVLLMLGAANRDPARFAEPDRFDIERRPGAHLAFGHGIHFCVGAPLARLEARVALTELLALPNLALVGDEPWEPRRAFHVHGPSYLAVTLNGTG